MNKRLQVRVEPLGEAGVAPRAYDEIVLAPDEPKFRPSDAAWMMVGLATQHVWVRHANDRNPFVVMKAELAVSDPDAFTRLLSVAAAIGFKARITPDFIARHPNAAKQIALFAELPAEERLAVKTALVMESVAAFA